jgi:hypothetical protein
MADSAGALPGIMPRSPGNQSENRALIDRVPELSGMRRQKNIIQIVGKFQRNLTDAQNNYMLKMLGNASFKHQHHHIFEKWTRTDILATTVILGILGIAEVALVNVWSSYQDIPSGSDTMTTAIGGLWKFLGPLSTITALVGFYGAWKIKFDVQQHIDDNGLGSAKLLKVGPKLAGDASVVEMQRWTSHKCLLAYFYLSWFTSVGTILAAVLTFVAGGDKKNPSTAATLELRDGPQALDIATDGDFDADNFAVQVAAYVMSIMGLFVACLTWFSMLPTIRMVSMYDVMQSLLEMINLLLMLVSVGMMLVSAILTKLALFIEGKTTVDDDGTSSAGTVTVMTCVGLYGIGCVILTFIGFVAAYRENKKLLLINAAALTFGLFVGLASIMLLANVDYRAMVDSSCDDILKFISEDFYDLFSCAKYNGYSEVWDPALGDWVAGTGAGESTQCDDKTMTTYAWEASPGLGRDGGDVSYWGCLNRDCCPKLGDFLSSIEWVAMLFVVLVMVACFFGVVAALYLYKETTIDQGQILVKHSGTKYIGVGLVFGFLTLCISLALIFNAGEFGDITQEQVETKTNLAVSGMHRPCCHPVFTAQESTPKTSQYCGR